MELINRARQNPSAEGARFATSTDPDVLSAYEFFGVDLALMQAQFNAIPAAPPLAPNEKLWIAARLHTGDMFTNQFQGHFSSGTHADLSTRLAAQSYPLQNAAENVYAYAESSWHGHAGFNVDWGYDPTGMQDPPGHRLNIHSPAYREIGVGVINGRNGSVGPQLVTQDFGTRFGTTPLITGVAFFDLNGNNFYDAGEGLGGVTVQVPGSGYYAVTAASGGYTVPVTTNGTYTVSFSANALATERLTTVSGGQNNKLDLVPVYNPPVPTGPATAVLNGSNYFSFTPVAAATRYEWQQSRLSPLAVEGAEDGTNRVLATVSPGYPLLANDAKYEGNFSFHMAHMSPAPTSQYLELLPDIRIGQGSQLSFAKRLGVASPDQVAVAQVSTNSGVSWDTVWSQAGTGSAGDASFTVVNVGLNQYAGKVARLRFVFRFSFGNYNPGATTGYGLYLDNIHILNADEINGTSLSSVGVGPSLVFSPTAPGDYLLRVRAVNIERKLPWGPDIRVQTQPPVPEIRINGSDVQIDVMVPSYSPGTQLQLFQSGSVNGPYIPVSAAFVPLGGNEFRVTTPVVGGSRFYRVQISQ